MFSKIWNKIIRLPIAYSNGTFTPFKELNVSAFHPFAISPAWTNNYTLFGIRSFAYNYVWKSL